MGKFRTVYYSLIFLFFSTATTVALFSRQSPDGGAWPIVLMISGMYDLIYAITVLKLIQYRKMIDSHAAAATIGLTILLFSTRNFDYLFGRDGIIVTIQVYVRAAGSEFTPFVLYVIAVVIPIFTKPNRDKSCRT